MPAAVKAMQEIADDSVFLLQRSLTVYRIKP
jgi:hypothetical protein